MNNNKVVKLIILVVLVVSTLAITIGFAAFSNILQIRSSADVNYDPSLILGVELSTLSTQIQSGSVRPSVIGAIADDGELTSSSIENISVHFTSTNQKATYTFYAVNPSSFVYYLNNVSFGNKTCTPYSKPSNPNPASVSYVNNACNSINMKITVGSDNYLSSNTNISNHSISATSYETIVVEIEYSSNGATADGDFTVDFGTTSLNYSTVD